MKTGIKFTKRDAAAVLCCLVFILLSIGAVGESGRRRAKEAVCLTNLGQWGKIFEAYTNDNEGYFMHGWYSNPTCPSCPFEPWYAALRTYVDIREQGISCCPMAGWRNLNLKSTSSTAGMPGSTFIPWGGPPPIWAFLGGMSGDCSSYGMNWYCYDEPLSSTGGIDSDYWRRTDVAGGDNIPVFADCTWPGGAPWDFEGPPEYDGAMM